MPGVWEEGDGEMVMVEGSIDVCWLRWMDNVSLLV
jgi:hypothetical protein